MIVKKLFVCIVMSIGLSMSLKAQSLTLNQIDKVVQEVALVTKEPVGEVEQDFTEKLATGGVLITGYTTSQLKVHYIWKEGVIEVILDETD